MLFFFLTECSLAPCQGGLEKAKAGTNWNLQVSNSHFSFSTWSFALRGFCSWVVVSVDISSHFYFLKKWKWVALYLMGADQQRHESRTCLGSLWWERQDNHEQNIPRESFLFNTFQFPGPTASAWTASIRVNEKILVHELPPTSGRLLCSAATHSHDAWSCVYVIPWSTRNVLIHLNSAQNLPWFVQRLMEGLSLFRAAGTVISLLEDSHWGLTILQRLLHQLQFPEVKMPFLTWLTEGSCNYK